jgi:6-pyruvoyltetrahydropterin/6-carboxytetrahydropterin synthase
MFTVTQILEFCYGHRLLEYQGKCAHIHGHNGRVEVVVGSKSLDGQSMVADFSEIERIVRGFVDQNLDHNALRATTRWSRPAPDEPLFSWTRIPPPSRSRG